MYGESFKFLNKVFQYYYTLHRSDLAAWAAPLDPRLPAVPQQWQITLNSEPKSTPI